MIEKYAASNSDAKITEDQKRTITRIANALGRAVYITDDISYDAAEKYIAELESELTEKHKAKTESRNWREN